MSKLQLSDIVDLREYERGRADFRNSIIALKAQRRISLGELLTVVFENKDTIRFQIQEMARAEKMLLDEQILAELDIYNPLIPEKGELKATLFLELTSKEMLEEWLPALVGVERSVYIEVGVGDTAKRVPAIPEGEHESQLTRADVTASVHYIEWKIDEGLRRRMASEKVFLGVDHPRYQAHVELPRASVNSLMSDWED